jgi:hypothetical protein
LTELGNITSADGAALWAQEVLAAKNRPAAADAKVVEGAFEHRLSELARPATAEAADDAPSTRVDSAGTHEMLTKENSDLDQPDGIDKSTLVIATLRHIADSPNEGRKEAYQSE